MSVLKRALTIDAWIQEAQEATKLLEDIETKVTKNKNQDQTQEHTSVLVIENARSKLHEVGVKIDRLESLLHNPPSKPILSKEDLVYRWEMVSDIKLRTKVLAHSLYKLRSLNKCIDRPGSSHDKEANIITKYNGQDQPKSFLGGYPELLNPLVLQNEIENQEQICVKESSVRTFLCQALWTLCLALGAIAFLIGLVIVTALI